MQEGKRSLGRKLFEVPGYTFRLSAGVHSANAGQRRDVSNLRDTVYRT
jgi:hypothetical protein